MIYDDDEMPSVDGYVRLPFSSYLQMHDGRFLLKSFDGNAFVSVDSTIESIEELIDCVGFIHGCGEYELDEEEYIQDYIDYISRES